MKEMLHWAATARSLWELQANANAESANRKMKPPWAILWPLTMCGLTVIASVASPVLISRISMPRPWLASSSFNIASAQARARSSDESVALTFTAVSLRISVAACRSESDANVSPRSPGWLETSLFGCGFSRLVLMPSHHRVNDSCRCGPVGEGWTGIGLKRYGSSEMACYLGPAGQCKPPRRQGKASAGRWQHCRHQRVADRSRLWRGRPVERLLPAERAARLVGQGRQPPDPDLCSGVGRECRGGAAAGRPWHRRSRQVDLPAAVVLGAADVCRRTIVRLRHGACERLRLPTGARAPGADPA